MNSLKRYLIWLSRISYCRGFGVQSPSAYRFIRYVINEHYPYYGYCDLETKYPSLDWLQRKRMELYFRVANYCQAQMMVDYSDDSKLLADYVKQGCHSTQVVNIVGRSVINVPLQLVRICPIGGSEKFLDELLMHSNHNTVLIVEDIHVDGIARCMWQCLVESTKVSVSYDLYYCGIAFFDVERHKTNYTVNF